MSRALAFVYGVICYVIFLVTFLYAIAFVGNLFDLKTIDSGHQGALVPSLIVDGVLLSLFAVQHSVMARQWFKRGWTRIVPQVVERSTYVLLASFVLLLLYWQWRPVTTAVWNIESAAGRLIMWALFWIGWITVLVSTFLVDHFGLFGLKQVYQHAKGIAAQPIPFKTPGLYKAVRHPLYLGFIVAFWSTPRMSVGHLFFAIMTTVYIVVAIQFEERDLIRSYGDSYRTYRQKVSMLIPIPRRR
jgi:methanethiol S-methyltransferase